MAMSHRGGLVLFMALTTMACGEAAEPQRVDPDALPPSEQLKILDRDLGPGSEGTQVRAVQQYLTEFGYFPNDAIALAYPRWRPVVPVAPRYGSYDEETALAVRALQTRSGLAETGIVDAATRTLLQTARCGYPDGAPEDPDEKYDPSFFFWNKRALTWKLLNTDDNIPISEARAAIAAAFASWQAETSLTFTETTGSADIQLRFEAINPDPQFNSLTVADTLAPQDGDIRFDSDDGWSVSTPQAPGAFDLQTIALHEIGHSVGIGHSGFQSATMFPTAVRAIDRNLSNDDSVGVSARYDIWQQVSGCAVDIGVSAAITGGVWITGCDDVPGGHGIYQLQSGSWVRVSGSAAAVRIAATSSNIYVVNSNNNVFRGSGTAPSLIWTSMPGCAIDIGSSATGGHVWITGCDGRVYKWNGSTSTWAPAIGTLTNAMTIAVDTSGVPWIVTSGSQVLRRTTNSATSGNWETLPGTGWDIGIGPPSYAWKVGQTFDLFAGGFEIHVWNEQPFASGGPNAPERKEWFAQSGRGRSISVERDADPWMVDFFGRIFKRER